MLVPLISMLVRAGVTHRAFSMMCKQVFVDVAAREYGIHGRVTNDTRIAMLTGIDRREVKRLKKTLASDEEEPIGLQNQNRVTRLLSGWHQDKEFLDDDGKPKPLSLDDESPSFAELAQRYGGDVTVSALQTEMLRGDVAEILDDGRIVALQRYYIPSQHDLDALVRGSVVIRDFGDLLVHNLYIAEPKESIPLRFERTATNCFIDREIVPEFQAFLEFEGQAYLERVDQWLTDHESADHHSEHNICVGSGAYLIYRDSPSPLDDHNADSAVPKEDSR